MVNEENRKRLPGVHEDEEKPDKREAVIEDKTKKTGPPATTPDRSDEARTAAKGPKSKQATAATARAVSKQANSPKRTSRPATKTAETAKRSARSARGAAETVKKAAGKAQDMATEERKKKLRESAKKTGEVSKKLMSKAAEVIAAGSDVTRERAAEAIDVADDYLEDLEEAEDFATSVHRAGPSDSEEAELANNVMQELQRINEQLDRIEREVTAADRGMDTAPEHRGDAPGRSRREQSAQDNLMGMGMGGDLMGGPSVGGGYGLGGGDPLEVEEDMVGGMLGAFDEPSDRDDGWSV